MQRDGEQQNEQQSHPVHREGNPEIRDAEREPVVPAAGMSSAQDAEEDAGERGKQHRGGGKLQRLRKPLADVSRDRTIRDVRPPEVSLDDVPHVVAEPDMQRIVQTKLLAQARDRGGIRALADHRGDRIARRDVQQQKGHDEDAEERGNGQEQPSNDEPTHGLFSSETFNQRCPL